MNNTPNETSDTSYSNGETKGPLQSRRSRVHDAIRTMGSFSAILVLFIYLSRSASNNHRLDELQDGIRHAEASLGQKIILLKEQVVSDSLVQEMAFKRLDMELKETARNNIRETEETPPQKPASRTPETPTRKLEPVLLPSEKPVFKEIMGLIKSGNKEAALDLLYASINEASSGAFYFIAGSLLARNDEIDKAVDFFLTALDKFPNFYRAARNAGVMQVQQEDFQGSKRNLLKAQSLGSNPDSTTNGLLGLSYLNTGDPVSAEHNYRSAIELQPEIKDWWLGLARSLLEQGKKAEGQETIEHIEKTFGKTPNKAE